MMPYYIITFLSQTFPSGSFNFFRVTSLKPDERCSVIHCQKGTIIPLKYALKLCNFGVLMSGVTWPTVLERRAVYVNAIALLFRQVWLLTVGVFGDCCVLLWYWISWLRHRSGSVDHSRWMLFLMWFLYHFLVSLI